MAEGFQFGVPTPPAPREGPKDVGDVLKRLAPLLAALPAVWKGGGPQSAAAFLQGLQQMRAQRDESQQQQYQNQLRAAQLQSLQGSRQDAAELRRQQAADKNAERRQAFFKDLRDTLSSPELENMSSVEAMRPYWEQRAAAVNVPPEQLNQIMSSMVTPDRLTTNKIRKALKNAPDELRQEWIRSQRALQIGGEEIPYATWSQVVPMVKDENGNPILPAGEEPTPPAVGSFGDFLRRSYGDNPTPDQVLSARKAYQQADDRPSEHVVTVPGPNGPITRLATEEELRRGVESYEPPSAAPRPTQDQSNAGLYASRIAQAEPAIQRVSRSISRMNPALFMAQTEGWFAKPTFQSEAVQQYMQAARNLINAVLRRESGAAISKDEFVEARQQYLPVPGDTKTVLEMKRKNRELVQRSLRSIAGSAFVDPNEPSNNDDEFDVDLQPGTEGMIGDTPVVWDGAGWLPR